MSGESGRSQTMKASNAGERPSWDEYFISIADDVRQRSTCLRRRVGAIVVKDKRILSTGYNGTPKGITNCSDGGCARCARVVETGTSLNECICVHAEENAIVQAASHGVAIRDATLYCTLCPCSYCAKSIINAGIVEVVFAGSYKMDEVTENLLREAKVVFRKLGTPSVSVKPHYARL